jgi:hypothetical protein
MPWDPINETKIYHWNDLGGATTWQLPESWQPLKEVLLYELTPLGRVVMFDSIRVRRPTVASRSGLEIFLDGTKESASNFGFRVIGIVRRS